MVVSLLVVVAVGGLLSGDRPWVWLSTTATGRAAFTAHVRALRAIIGG